MTRDTFPLNLGNFSQFFCLYLLFRSRMTSGCFFFAVPSILLQQTLRVFLAVFFPLLPLFPFHFGQLPEGVSSYPSILYHRSLQLRSFLVHHLIQDPVVIDGKRGTQVAGRPKHELLATAAELCRVVCSNWLRHITSNSF